MPATALVPFMLEHHMICLRNTDALSRIVSRSDHGAWMRGLRRLLLACFRKQGPGGSFQAHGVSNLYRIRMSFTFHQNYNMCPDMMKHRCA